MKAISKIISSSSSRSSSSIRSTNSVKKGISNSISNSISSRRRYSSDADAEMSLMSFPEYKEALILEEQGKTSQALPLLRRVHDVVASAMGKGSMLSAYTSMKIATVLKDDGKYSIAERELGIENLSGISKAKALQLAAICRIMSGTSDAIVIAKQSTDILQSEQSSLSLLSSSYCTQGIAHFCQGHFHDAEDYLAMAARWSENSTQQAISYGNLGALHWLRNDMNSGDSLNNYYKRALYNRIASPMKGEKRGLGIDISDDVKNKTNDAIGYWLEGVENATNPNTNYEMGGCGPSVGAAGPGVDPIIVNIDKKKDKDKKTVNLDFNLKDVKFTIAYVTLLNNLAEAYHLVDNMDGRFEILSSALKAMDNHKDNILCAPILGRTLGQIGIDNVLSTNAVTAEGLFRSSLDKFKHSNNDKRHLYEKANVLLAYGHLLQKWDKREESGKKLINESFDIYNSLYGHDVSDKCDSIDDAFKGLRLTQVLQFQM